MSSPEALNVSRETFERLQIYADLLKKWNPRINLVAKSTLDDLWSRHFMDSTQLLGLLDAPVDHWADLGSGGGFPGLVIALMRDEPNAPHKVTLVESDLRKCTFLRTVLRETGVVADVINARIEAVEPLGVNILSARALADLSFLLSFVDRHMHKDGIELLPKGANWQAELQEAQTKWHFAYSVAKSQTETGPVILKISGVSRV